MTADTTVMKAFCEVVGCNLNQVLVSDETVSTRVSVDDGHFSYREVRREVWVGTKHRDEHFVCADCVTAGKIPAHIVGDATRYM